VENFYYEEFDWGVRLCSPNGDSMRLEGMKADEFLHEFYQCEDDKTQEGLCISSYFIWGEQEC